MNDNELYVVEEYNFDYPLISKKESVIDYCYKDCHNKYFYTFIY